MISAQARSRRVSNSQEQDHFLTLLPAIRQRAGAAFRHWSVDAREEAVQEVVANAYVAYARLVELGKVDVAYATPLAEFAVRQFRDGRRVGSRRNRRDVMSPLSRRDQRFRDQPFTVERLDQLDSGTGEWCEVIVEDKHAGPAETAAARLDVAAWFRTLGPRNRIR